MPAVFIHGVADTYRVWDRVLKSLTRSDILTLSLPGFDSPIPPTFKATKEEYITWIIGELERQKEPVDLVGHDWGCIFTARIASLRPGLVRTWAGGNGPLNRHYEWHSLAKLFQTPEVGEEWMAKLEPKEFTFLLEQLGMPRVDAEQAPKYMDETMKDCILKLYRSAVRVGDEWQPDLSMVTAPGLVFWGKHDTACPVDFAYRLANDTGALRTLEIDAGHWCILEKPDVVAQALEQHWHPEMFAAPYER